ncbi:MAG: sulfatase [Planctomycetota bacterium]
MRHQKIACWAGWLALLVLSFASRAEAPNIVYLMTDDQRADAVGFMGNTLIQTPNLDTLAGNGVVFDNAFVPTAICMANRASVLTGQYAARHDLWSFGEDLTAHQLNNSYIGQLDQAGYYTGFVGKWGVGNPQADAVNNIIDFNKGFSGQGSYFTTRDDGSPVHLTQLIGEQASSFIGQAAGQTSPFALSVSFKSPHAQDGLGAGEFLQYNPALGGLYADDTIPDAVLSDQAFFNAQPEFIRNSLNRSRWQDRYVTGERYQESVKGYYRLMTGVDNAVGEIMRALRDPDGDGDTSDSVADNTIVIFTSDHGLYLGDRGLAGKWLAHEQSMKVPLVIHDPRHTDGHGTRRDELALSIDMAATILEYAGVEAPEAMQGSSLVLLVEGRDTVWREEFFYEHRFDHSSIPESEAVRTERWKYIKYIDHDYEELYDLDADPIEAVNLAEEPAYAAVLGEMRFKLDAWRSLTRDSDTLPNAVAVPEPNSLLLVCFTAAAATVVRRGRSRWC